VPEKITLTKGEPVTLKLSSTDVEHSLYVRDLKINETIEPGQVATITFVPENEGTYHGNLSNVLRRRARTNEADNRGGVESDVSVSLGAIDGVAPAAARDASGVQGQPVGWNRILAGPTNQAFFDNPG